MALYATANQAIRSGKPQGAHVGAAISDEARDFGAGLTRYIPAETVTLYVATIAVIPVLQSEVYEGIKPWWAYAFWAVLTPIIWFLILRGKTRRDTTGRKPTRAWKIWGGTSSVIAFLAWALVVPNGPLLQSEQGAVVAAFLALFVSTFLNLIAGQFTGEEGTATAVARGA
jgi:hypothetical protein